MHTRTPHGFTILATLLVIFLGLFWLAGRADGSTQTGLAAPPPADDQDQGSAAPVDAAAFALPYPEYVITQGLHGYSYGHMAIDLAAGKGATIYSPIHGEVTQLYTDSYGNPTLVIENDVYQVTLLHGEYSVSPGSKVNLGDPIGIESNIGYTVDFNGRSCWGRDCGYHTHLNVFDKRLNQNVDPLSLVGD